jgi:hypothetical protein
LEVIEVILFLLALILVFSFVAGSGKRQSIRKGKRGETKVGQYLSRYCNKNPGTHVLNNVTLRLSDGSTTQIDHILLSTKGIFVIETKNYSGWIFANSRSKVWTRIFYKEKYKFQNPLFQNYRHVKAIQELFTFLRSQHIHNIVVFTGEVEFKTEVPSNVLYLEELIPRIEQFRDGVLSLNHIQYSVDRLEYLRLELSRKTDVEHQTNLTQRLGR